MRPTDNRPPVAPSRLGGFIDLNEKNPFTRMMKMLAKIASSAGQHHHAAQLLGMVTPPDELLPASVLRRRPAPAPRPA